MPDKLKVYIIAGEASGDFIGSKLMASLKMQHPKISFFGVGGALMENEGLKTLFPMSNLAIMGFVEVISKIFTIKNLLKKTVEDISRVNPDILITIDSLGFNKRVAKAIKQINPNIKLVHYVAPSVWAWKPGRAKEIAKIYDYLLCLFDFEVPYFTKEGLQTYFVGHPIVESGADKGNPDIIKNKYNINANDNIVLIMPGSRITEISKLLPIFIKSLIQLRLKYNKKLVAVLPTIPHLYNYINNYISSNNIPDIIIIKDVSEKYSAFKQAKLAIVASGTATLELSLANIPCIGAYRVNWLTHIIVKVLVKIKYASIINIMAKKEIIKEFLQYDCTPENIANQAFATLENPNYINNKEVEDIMLRLGLNNFVPSNKAASIILEIINK